MIKTCFATFCIIIFCLLIKSVENKCDSIYSTISMKSQNEGFHREIQYTINLIEQKGLDFWSHGGCRLALEQSLPSGAYVNSDELQDLRRLNKVHACPVGNIDVEKPKHMSRPLIVHIYSLVNSSQILISLPIHLRYHKAKTKGGFETVKINLPSVYLRCPNNVFKLCENTNTATVPCAACSPHSCSWHNLTVKHLSAQLLMNVPVGNLSDFNCVAIVTFLTCFAGCFFIILTLSKTNVSSDVCNKKQSHKTK